MSEATVVIAAWHAADTVGRSVSSALRQTDIETEAVVVDDASCDTTAKAAGEAGARVFRLASNGGPSAARNRALAEAQGLWIAVLDADDIMRPGRLRDMVDLGMRTQADIVLGNFQRIDKNGNFLEDTPFLHGSPFEKPCVWTLEDYLAGNQLVPGSRPLGYLKPLFRKEFLETTGLRYDLSLRNGEDFHLILASLAAGGRVVYSPAPDYLYTIRHGSISHRADPAHIEALLHADTAFVEQHADTLSDKAQILFARRRNALCELQISENILQQFKARKLLRAVYTLGKNPWVSGRVVWQLAEATLKRIGSKPRT